jgi:hypothetical protein
MKSALVLALALAVSLLFLAGCSTSGSTTPPPPAMYTISGTVANLAGSGGVVLQDNSADNLQVTVNGSFHFSTTVASGSSYSVTVLTQPSSPAQQCTVANGSGSATGNITNVKVECGHNEWAWMSGSQAINQLGTYGTMGTAAPGNTPAGRQYPATWTDSSGNLWLFGGYGPDSNGTIWPINDLWEFSAGEWTWKGGPTVGGQSGNYGSLGVASANGVPGARFEAASWMDSGGNFWLFGGNGFDSVGHETPMNDLWKYSAGEWTWVGGSSVGNQNGHYGTLGVADPSNHPGGRGGAAMWKDSSGDIWIFGGIGYDETNPINGFLSDLWKYSGGQWTRMGGPKIQQQKGIYGTQGTPSASNIPGARYLADNWIDASGNLWLFGGSTYDANGTGGYVNDLWKYSNGEWTWVAGGKVVNQPGVWGTLGVAAANNIPGPRWGSVVWTDASGNTWLFGGGALDANGHFGFANDLWKFSGGEWTWVSGSNTVNQDSSFGTVGTLDPGNVPSGRFSLNGWSDANGNLWLFGGYGQVPGTTGNLNDLWMYMP